MDWKQNWSRCIGRDEDWIPADSVRRDEPSPEAANFVNTVNYVNKTPKCICNDLEELQHLTEYLVENMRSGGAYARLFLNVRAYLRRELASTQFNEVEKAFMENRGKVAKHTEVFRTEATSYPDEQGRVKCAYCRNLSEVHCRKLHQPDGISLLRTCDDFEQRTRENEENKRHLQEKPQSKRDKAYRWGSRVSSLGGCLARPEATIVTDIPAGASHWESH